MSDIGKLVEQAVDKKLRTSGAYLKRTTGVISAADENSVYGTVDLNGKSVTLLNKTGEELTIGDEVTIHYWTYISDGYIALRHGEANRSAGVLIIENALVYDSSDTAGALVDKLDSEFANTAYGISVYSNSTTNPFLVQGYMTSVSSQTTAFRQITLYRNDVELIGKYRYFSRVTTVSMGFIGSNLYPVYMYSLYAEDPEGGTNVIGKTSNTYYFQAYPNLYLSGAFSAPSDTYEYGSAQVKISVGSTFANSTGICSFTCGFSSIDEYNYAASITTASEIERKR